MLKLVIILLTVILHFSPVGASPILFEEGKMKTYEQDKIHTYTHIATGMQIVWIENKDSNASFMLGVKTPTHNSTGVNHIIEHTVFTGSKNYPSGTLFFDASNTYPHTFMNAMTSSDRTLYPFSTPYKESFEKLLGIYLDSIFNPNMLKQKNSFYEESFHYNPFTKNYGGVVYNEMKGANDDINRGIFRSIRQTLYKDTHYANDSGGEPKDIQGLTYDEFIMTYKAYYRPGNMMIVLYGDLAIQNTLKTIDKVIKDYPKIDKNVNVCVEPKFSTNKTIFTNKALKDRSYIIKSLLIHRPLSPEEEIEMDAWINTYLVEESSYFMSRLRQLGIAKVRIEKDSDTQYPIYSIILPEVPIDSIEVTENNLNKVLEEMQSIEYKDQRVEQDVLAKNKLSTYTIDTLTNRGINISESIVEAWAHDKALDQYFRMKEHMDDLKSIPFTCRDSLLKTPYQANSVILPEKVKEISEPLAFSKMSEQEWEKVIQNMLKWQEEQKTKGLKTIPLKKLVMEANLKYELKEKGMHYILTYTDTELLNTEIYLPTSHIKQEDLPYLFLYTYMLKEAAKDISPFEGICLSDNAVIYEKNGYVPYLNVSMLTSSKDQPSYELLNKARKVLLDKDMRWYTRKLNQYVTNFKEKSEANILDTLGIMNKGGMIKGKRYEYEMSFPLYTVCEKILQEKDVSWIQSVKEMDKELKLNNQTYIGLTGNRQNVKANYIKWCNDYQNPIEISKKYADYTWDELIKDSLYAHTSEVDYIVYSYDTKLKTIQGSDYVMASFVTKNYLQPHIRIQKGAYGSSMSAVFPNSLSLYTYRDPNYKTSLQAIHAMPSKLEKLITSETLASAKANALSRFQNQMKLLENDLLKVEMLHKTLLMGDTPSTLVKFQNEIIKTQQVDLFQACKKLKDILKDSALSVCTSKQMNVQDKRLYKLN